MPVIHKKLPYGKSVCPGVYIKLLESPIPAGAPPPSQKASSDDISGTKRGTIEEKKC